MFPHVEHGSESASEARKDSTESDAPRKARETCWSVDFIDRLWHSRHPHHHHLSSPTGGPRISSKEFRSRSGWMTRTTKCSAMLSVCWSAFKLGRSYFMAIHLVFSGQEPPDGIRGDPPWTLRGLPSCGRTSPRSRSTPRERPRSGFRSPCTHQLLAA